MGLESLSKTWRGRHGLVAILVPVLEFQLSQGGGRVIFVFWRSCSGGRVCDRPKCGTRVASYGLQSGPGAWHEPGRSVRSILTSNLKEHGDTRTWIATSRHQTLYFEALYQYYPKNIRIINRGHAEGLFQAQTRVILTTRTSMELRTKRGAPAKKRVNAQAGGAEISRVVSDAQAKPSKIRSEETQDQSWPSAVSSLEYFLDLSIANNHQSSSATARRSQSHRQASWCLPNHLPIIHHGAQD